MMTRFFGLCAAVAIRMPRGLLDFLVGKLLLRWGFFRHPARRRIILANYRRILSHGGARPTEKQLRAVLEETVPLYSRLILSMLARPEDVAFARERVDVSDLLKRMDEARRGGRGVIVAFSNFGFFTYALAALLSRRVPLRIPVLKRETYRHLPPDWRGSFLTVGKSSRPCLEALKRNEAVAVLTMVNYMARRPPLELFGAPARLGYAPARLALSAQAPILPAFALVQENDRCQVLCEDIIAPDSGPGAVERMTARLARVQEKYIGRYPAQWFVYDDFWDLRWMDANYKLVRWASRWI